MHTSATAMPETTLRGRLEANNGRGFKWMMATGAVLLALVFPVQAIAMLVLLTAAMLCIGVYNTWLHHHAMARRQRRTLNHAVGDVTLVVLGLGVVAAAIFPVPTMAVALCLAVVASGAWGAAWIIEFIRAAEAPQSRTASVQLRSRMQHPSTASTTRMRTRERSSSKVAA